MDCQLKLYHESELFNLIIESHCYSLFPMSLLHTSFTIQFVPLNWVTLLMYPVFFK